MSVLGRGTALVAVVCIFGCGGGSSGGGGPSPGGSSGPRNVHITWAASHQSGVNKAGGGYQVSITGQPTANIPYVSGPTAPTSYDIVLSPGSYVVTVRAFALLDAQGGASGTTSAPSQQITVNIP